MRPESCKRGRGTGSNRDLCLPWFRVQSRFLDVKNELQHPADDASSRLHMLLDGTKKRHAVKGFRCHCLTDVRGVNTKSECRAQTLTGNTVRQPKPLIDAQDASEVEKLGDGAFVIFIPAPCKESPMFAAPCPNSPIYRHHGSHSCRSPRCVP